MRRFMERWVANLIGLLVAAYFVKGISYDSGGSLALASLVLGVANMTVKPLLVILAFPVEILSLGLFTLVINGVVLKIVSSLVQGFTVTGLWPAILGSIVISIVGGLLYNVIANSD